MYSLEGLDIVAKLTVKEFYNMNECQREFITKLAENENVKWTRVELMKMLMIYNKSIELSCEVDSYKINLFSKFIDDNSKIINNYLNACDKEYRTECGVA